MWRSSVPKDALSNMFRWLIDSTILQGIVMISIQLFHSSDYGMHRAWRNISGVRT